MLRLYIHDDARGDLENLWLSQTQTAARIAVLLEELQNSQDLLDRLTQHDFGRYRSADFHVSKWQQEWRKGNDLWRLKVWDLENSGLQYRIVYAFVPEKGHYHILGIVPRNFNYDSSHPLTQRILGAYSNL